MSNFDKIKDFLTPKAQDAISELKEINTLLTEIQKTGNALSQSELERIGSEAFTAANRYGKAAAEYLEAAQEAAAAGYGNAADIAELSLAAQNAGGITAELAGQYINATDRAYQLGGSIRELTEILDGANAVSINNAVDMAGLAEGMSIAGGYAAALGLESDEATAALAAIISATGQSGSEAAESLKAILSLIQQVTDENQGIDGAGIAKYANSCRALGVTLKETRNGITSLREPMDVLKDLAEAYTHLTPGDTRGTDLLASLGSTQSADALSALLGDYDMYEKMLQDYADGTGTMAAQAELSANSWEGALSRLSNTWTDTMGNLVSSDAAIAAIDSLNGILSVVKKLTEFLGPLTTAGIGIGLAAGIKNVGRAECQPSRRICLQQCISYPKDKFSGIALCGTRN